MNRIQLEILTILVVIAAVLGLVIIGLILIARIPPDYLAFFGGLMLLFAAYVIGVVIPALGIISLVMMLLIGGVTIGLVVRKATASKGCLIATTAGLVSGIAFIILAGVFQIVVAVLL